MLNTYEELTVSQAIELYNDFGIAIECSGDTKTFKTVYEDIKIGGDIQ